MNLVSIKPENRITHEELWGMIGEHAQEIKERKNFLIGNVPVKVHEEVGRYREVTGKVGGGNINIQPQLLETSTVIKH